MTFIAYFITTLTSLIISMSTRTQWRQQQPKTFYTVSQKKNVTLFIFVIA